MLPGDLGGRVAKGVVVMNSIRECFFCIFFKAKKMILGGFIENLTHKLQKTSLIPVLCQTGVLCEFFINVQPQIGCGPVLKAKRTLWKRQYSV